MLLCISLSALFGCQLPAMAQNSDEDDLQQLYGAKSMLSIASGYLQPLSRAPAVASVLHAEDIRAMGARNLCEAIAAIPGMSCHADMQAYGDKFVIRGLGHGAATNPQVLILQNGVNRASITSGDGGVPFVFVPLENVARIEVIRGPASALYGADAYAGVINIISKKAADAPGTEAGLRFGSQNTRQFWLQHGLRKGELDLALYLHHQKTDGVRETVRSDAASLLDSLTGTRSSNAPGLTDNRHEDLDLSMDLGYRNWRLYFLHRLRDNIGAGPGYAGALESPGRQSRLRSERNLFLLQYRDAELAPMLGLQANLSYTNLHDANQSAKPIELLPPGVALPGGAFPEGVLALPWRAEHHLRLSADLSYRGWRNQQWRLGAGIEDLDLYRAGNRNNFLLAPDGSLMPIGPLQDVSALQPHIRPQRRKLHYVFLQNEWRIDPFWSLTAGWRHDRYSDFGSVSNPRMALVWKTGNLHHKLLYGKAFRAPTFNESYGINPTNNGNPAIRPETIQTWEWSSAWQAHADLQLQMNLFHYRRNNIIAAQANPAPSSGATYVNGGAQRGKGLELEMDWRINPALRLIGNMSWQRNHDQVLQAEAGLAPQRQAYARLEWRMAPGWNLHTQFKQVSQRARALGDPRAPIADARTLDLMLQYARRPGNWEFHLNLKNLLNADVRDPSLTPALADDIPLARRSIYAQAVYRF
ncbi:TonB-dependent receptor [Massilia sp. W12]|uniref:TonB-dependent receptor plug domain-containing protein n=1 Tax=Massilia sp. W12 TaxID=3126507 RepID=UPI0030CBCBBB